MFVHSMHTVPGVGRGGYWIFWFWCYRRLWGPIQVLGTKPYSSTSVERAPNHWVISLAPTNVCLPHISLVSPSVLTRHGSTLANVTYQWAQDEKTVMRNAKSLLGHCSFPGNVPGQTFTSLLNHLVSFYTNVGKPNFRHSKSCGAKPMSHSMLKIQIGNVLPSHIFLSSPCNPMFPVQNWRKCVPYINRKIVFLLIPGFGTVYLLTYIPQNPNPSLPHYNKFCILFWKNI